jgi:hypothetical protein
MSIFSKIGKAINRGAQSISKAVVKGVVKKGVAQNNAAGGIITASQIHNALEQGNVSSVHAFFGKNVTRLAGTTAVGLATFGVGSLIAGGTSLASVGAALKTVKSGAQTLIPKAGVGGLTKLVTTTKTITDATKSLSSNPQMDITSLLKTASTVYGGLNLSQASVSGGAISVPTGQAGSGIFSTLVNAASGLLGKLPVSVQPPVAAAVGGATPLASGGGIVLSVPPLNKGSVSVKTSEPVPVSQSDNSFLTIALFAGLGFFIIKKLL